ncbi:MAG: hypothetical protein WC736_15625 [Gallionella sp.]
MDKIEFPRLVYRALKDGKTCEHHLVEEQEAYDEKLADGWYGSVPEALAAGAGAPAGKPGSDGSDSHGNGKDDEKPPTRAELEEQARKLGISFQPNIGDKKLRTRIEIALQGGGQ